MRPRRGSPEPLPRPTAMQIPISCSATIHETSRALKAGDSSSMPGRPELVSLSNSAGPPQRGGFRRRSSVSCPGGPIQGLYVGLPPDPVLRPIQRMLPMRGWGIDFSPLVAILAIIFIQKFLVASLTELAWRLR